MKLSTLHMEETAISCQIIERRPGNAIVRNQEEITE
jgi:hypothetical protein